MTQTKDRNARVHEVTRVEEKVENPGIYLQERWQTYLVRMEER